MIQITDSVSTRLTLAIQLHNEVHICACMNSIFATGDYKRLVARHRGLIYTPYAKTYISFNYQPNNLNNSQ